jgi:hypothetical protein
MEKTMSEQTRPTHYIIPAELGDALVQYLATRPIGEALPLFNGLQKDARPYVEPKPMPEPEPMPMPEPEPKPEPVQEA